MKERPILFTPENVAKIQRNEKWQTRRVIFNDDPRDHMPWWCQDHWQDGDELLRCPFGQPGDRLWVRESLVEEGGQWFYRADRAPVLVDKAHEAECIAWAHHKSTSYASAIHMPRWACRTVLEITEVRVERLHRIGEDSAKAEGVEPKWAVSVERGESYQSYCAAFIDLWDSINGASHPWSSNPWVWVITFKRVQP